MSDTILVSESYGVIHLAPEVPSTIIEWTGFANSEERAAGLIDVVPFLVEDMLKAHGGQYSQAADWQVHVVVDGGLITGQNPASSGPAALALLQRLR